MSLKVIQAIKHFNSIIQAAWNSTPSCDTKEHHISTFVTIREKLKEKHNLRKQWQYYRSSITKINKVIKDLKKLLGVEKNASIQCIYATSVSLKHLITLYGKLLKN